jgi:acyl-[acyl-carrier-protein]-phospholipid O-acyltransferase/long-chain-fatty-acid--[acyl-carrier-protein] ligase
MAKVKPEDPAVILFTSGSEGKPKGVVLSHNALLYNAAQIRAVFDFNNKEKFFSALPVFHAFGLTGGVILPLLRGCPVLIYPSPLHYRMVPEMVYDQDCTVLFSTNTFLANYAKAAHPYDLARVKYLVVGAEKLSDDVRKLCMDKFGMRVLEGYGATECAPVIAVNTPLANRPGTVGEILPGMEWKLHPVPGITEGGELHVKGENLMLGYLKEDKPGVLQPPSSVYGPGWYDTGDVVTVETTGYVTIRGRIKRFAKIAGEMVSLEVVEAIAVEASAASLHAAVAVKDSARGEVLVLYTQDAGLTRERLVEAARALGAPELAVPRRIVHMDKIPLLGNGKKDYVALGKLNTAAV